MIAPFQKELLAEIDAARALLLSFWGAAIIRARCFGGGCRALGVMGVKRGGDEKPLPKWVSLLDGELAPSDRKSKRARRVNFVPENRQQLSEALGSNGLLIVDLIPELELTWESKLQFLS
jgi:hypothetical protein